ncbi:Uncharacterised protein [Raoultella terrigena]|uniref:Uncharacterized protein n=1 Tax=Raoultella terrigena TaxID=577 RepID=A0A4U9CWI2_RAOTE|nr:Uncharacterised protein [Raoultella terrigena]
MDAEYDKVFSPPSVSGLLHAANECLLQKLNGFDERYFMYLEDVDLCRRALPFTKIYYFPDATIIHLFNKGYIKASCCFGIMFALRFPTLISGDGFLTARGCVNKKALLEIPRKLG